MNFLTALVTSLAVTSAVYVLYRAIFSGTERMSSIIQKRVGKILQNHPTTHTAPSEHNHKDDALQTYLDHIISTRKIANWLLLAGIRIPFYQILLLLTIVSIFTFAVFAVFQLPLLLCGAVIAVVWVTPYLALKRARQTYISQFSEQLPNAVGMMANTLNVGHTPESALKLVAEISPKPLSIEFSKIQNEMMFGASFIDALKHLHERVPTTEVKILATALGVQQKAGGNLGELLRNLETMIRDRYAIQREAHALTGEARMSMVVMCVLPFVVMVPQYLRNPQKTLDFIQTMEGKAIYGMAVFFMLLGIYFFNQITKMEDF